MSTDQIIQTSYQFLNQYTAPVFSLNKLLLKDFLATACETLEHKKCSKYMQQLLPNRHIYIYNTLLSSFPPLAQ